MQVLLRDNAPQHPLTEPLDVGAARLKLLRWPDASPAAGGAADDLRAAPEPAPGLYALGGEVPRPGAAPLRRAFWLPVARWDVRLHPIPRFESVRTGYNARWAKQPQTLDAPPYDHRVVSALAMHDLLPLMRGRPERQQWFGAVASTRVELPGGPYRFSANSDDGLRLWVDGRLVLDNWFGHASFTFDADVTLDPHPHDLRVEFFQHVGGYDLWLQIEPRSPEARRLAAGLGGGIPQLEAHLVNVGHRARAGRDDAAVNGELAYVQAMAGRFDESRATYARVVRMDGGQRVNAYLLACLLAHQADAGAYAEHCAAMLDRFGADADPTACEQTVRACCVAPGPASADPRLIELVDRVRRAEADSNAARAPWNRLAVAMYEYRSGRAESALAGFRSASSMFAEDLPARLTADGFAAMCEQRLGRTDDARASLARVAATFEEQAPIPRVDYLPHGQVDHWLACYTVLREARGLIR
jgi:hypothetical protein